MILLLGSTGFIGSAFARELNRRDARWAAFRRGGFQPDFGLASGHIDLVINCAAFIPPQSVSLCDEHRSETLEANVLLPVKLTEACALHGIPIAHISTGCLWSDGKEHSEADEPQRAFNGYCGFYVGTKFVSEEFVRQVEKHYVWRIRLPFDEQDSPRNYLSKLAAFDEVWDHVNSASHRADFARACLDLWECRAPWGTYHVTNFGSIKATVIVERLLARGIRRHPPKILTGLRGDCQLNIQKLLGTGVKIRSIGEAIDESLAKWKAKP